MLKYFIFGICFISFIYPILESLVNLIIQCIEFIILIIASKSQLIKQKTLLQTEELELEEKDTPLIGFKFSKKDEDEND